MQNYLEAVTRVIALMKLPDSPCKDIAVHTACYMGLFQHLVTENKEFSMDAALEWLGKKKNSICRNAYTAYRRALFRLEHYLLFGDIDSPLCRSEEDFLCRSGMSESFFRLLRELEDYYYLEQNPSYFHTYSVAIKAFFRVATHMGITEPEAITIEVLLQYEDAYVTVLASDQRQKNAVCAIHTLMKYLHKRGDVPYCYQLVLFNGNSEKLRGMLLSTNGRAFHPSVCLEANAKEYLAALREWNYRDSSLALYQTDFDWYFMFLEINHLEHSKQSVELWSGVLPDYPLQKKANCSPKARRIRTINNFEHFLKGFSTGSTSRERVSVYDALPEWSLTILDGFVESRRLDGMTEHTLKMCRAASGNFFLYLNRTGVKESAEITPDVIKAFYNQDHHSTPESKNAYSIKLRQLLEYMADRNLVRRTLCYAVPTTFAPRRTIVNVLSDELVANIYDYRKKASEPLELRDVAIVLLGLRMGIRGADILNLRITDFNWKNRTVTFVQQKTRKEITLPVPTDVGNSVYKYITCGRPSSAQSGSGFVFIRHKAPYVPFSAESIVCTSSLKRILRSYGVELDKGDGFHTTRKTFATRMLRAENRIEEISSALGHARTETAEVYLERDEKSMRLCPLPFGGVL